MPSFSRALTLQRSIEQIDGVVDLKAREFARGLLTLEVVHEARIAFSAALLRIDDLRLRLVDESSSLVTLAFDG